MLQKIKAVFTDLDGTLYNSEHTLSARTVKAIAALKERGIPFIVATGRPFPDVFANLETTGLKPDFIITSNGSRVHDANHELVFACDLNPESVCRIFQLPAELDDDGVVNPISPTRCIQYNLNCGARWLTNERRDEIRAMFHPSLNYEEVDRMAQTPETIKGTHSMYGWGKHEDLLCVQRYIQRELPDVSSAFPLPHILDCFPSGNHKGVAMRKVCEQLGITPRETIAFGDGMNDVQMLSEAGQGFVMANAAPMVREATKGLPVIGSNREDAVAAKIEELLEADAFAG
ncbi:haloacid dehalogenase-like hydrolase-like protein [Leptomonas pyrrhocoris]|uniref:Haloacid dehalogenase-like hydrolase-like protein n=1 Tax=Leptomonas pyrrhocoris TaxID=157538 RepID=A0A0M9G942_LEPPY|nr:haloacid dehalogenase-like hydrolase-like protein [Leptomonas pyrrhocoris]KPA85360.1 haloacid dehalogenase-like hydrolase-like protein [Leptomonas pyrrhocoris]|eukprot:XP_015663799.1 haloacid dehalogenase-like hydrolase-like protein [Leptomonas pyrrhocoris]